MLSSSSEYIKALREGKYLLFLEWPQFIAEYYKEGEVGQDADDTVNLLVFDWLNNGYCDEDAKKVALLFAVHDLKVQPLRGSLAYALTAISIAAFQCMVYHNMHVQAQFLSKEKMTLDKIIKLMKGPIDGLDKSNFESLLLKQRASFFTWVEKMDSTQVEKARIQITSITDFRYLVEEYISAFLDVEISNGLHDELKVSRFSVVKRLARYLNEQTELTVVVKEEIATYVNKIREMKPADFENKYLLRLSPILLEDNPWKTITVFGISFFNLLQPTQPIVLKTSPDKSTIILS